MKQTVRALLACVLLLSVAACAAPAQPTPTSVPQDETFRIGLMPANLFTEFYILLADTVKEEAAKTPNIKVEVLAPSLATAVDESMKIIEDFTEKRVDLIALGTSTWDALAPALAKAREAGIEVVFLDRTADVEGVDALSKLGADEVAGGVSVGEFVVDLLEGKGKVAILTGVSGSYHAEKRTEGFKSVVDNHPGIEIVAMQAANWQRELGMTTAADIIQANPDLDLIWGQNDSMALGAMTAVESANLQGQVRIVGYTGFEEAREEVKAGKMEATFMSQPIEYAKIVVNQIVPALLAGKRDIIQESYELPMVVITRANVDAYLDTSEVSAREFRIGLMPANLFTEFYILLADTVKEEAAKTPNVKVEVLAPSLATAVDESMKIIEDFTEKRVDLIALGTSTWDALAPALAKAREAGIEVVFLDRTADVEGVDALSKLGADEVAGGVSVGEFVVDLLEGKGKVAILTGVSGSYHAEKRTEGFKSVVDNHPGIEIVAMQAANWQRELGMTTAADIIQANPDLDLIWGQNDSMALGAMTAVESANLQGQVRIVGYTGFEEAREEVKAGKMEATFMSQPIEYAKIVVNQIVPALLAGKRDIIQESYELPMVVITRANVDAYLDTSEVSAREFRIGLMPANLFTEFYILLADTVKEEAAKTPNVKVEVLAPSLATAVDESMKIIEDFTEKRVDLIALGTSTWDALAPALAKAREAGIEVVFLDRTADVEGVDALSKLGADEVAGGVSVGEFVVDLLEGKGKVAILTGVSGSYHAEKRTEGFKSVVDNHPGIEIVAMQAANWQRELGMTTAADIIQANPDLDLIWGQNDSMALGAMTAVESANLQGQVRIVGYTGFEEAREEVKAGKMEATFMSQPIEYAKIVVNQIVPALLAGKRDIIQETYELPMVVITRANVDAYLD